jgi:hypothetical protein
MTQRRHLLQMAESPIADSRPGKRQDLQVRDLCHGLHAGIGHPRLIQTQAAQRHVCQRGHVVIANIPSLSSGRVRPQPE